MYKNNCKCGATKFYLQYKGSMVGKYCSGCNKWQRWVGKKDLEVYTRNGYVVLKEDRISIPNSNTPSFKPCTKCGSDKFYLRYNGEMVGKYCESCDKWSTWVGRKVLEDLRYMGYKVNEESYVNPNITVVDDKEVTLKGVSNCQKCGGSGFYIKERGANIGKYCSSCNKWLKWVSKSEVKLLQSQGIKVQSEMYLSHNKGCCSDTTKSASDSSRYVDHSDVYISEYNKNNADCNSVSDGNNSIKCENILNKDDLNINKKDYDSAKKDVNNLKNDINISNFKYNLEKNEANMFLLEKFIANTPNDCYSCRLESKCDMMVVKLCDSIKDAIDFIADSEVF